MAEHPSCSNRKDLCPDVNITCTIDSTNVRYCDGLQGTVLIHDSTVGIVNVSVGLVQNEELSRAFPPIWLVELSRKPLDFRWNCVLLSLVDVVRETIDIGSEVNLEIPFVFHPALSYVANDFSCDHFQLGFSLRVCVLFSNDARCIRCIPVHFSF